MLNTTFKDLEHNIVMHDRSNSFKKVNNLSVRKLKVPKQMVVRTCFLM